MPGKDDCLPCQGYCKQGAVCLNRTMAQKILNSIQDGSGEGWTDEQIVWALVVTGDLPVAD